LEVSRLIPPASPLASRPDQARSEVRDTVSG
jgi:hypothetical protein